MDRQKQASGRECFVCGVENPAGLKLRFYQTGPGEVTVDFTPPVQYQGYPGILHGGIAAAILDETAGRAHMGLFPPRFMFTARLEVKYRRTIPIGQPLRAVGRAVRERGRLAEGWSGIYSSDGQLLAEATALLADIPDPPAPEQLELSGWKVYPDQD